MASVNEQITDAVTQSNVKVLAEAPAMAMGTIYQALGHSTAMMFENSVNSQQQQNMLHQSATAQGVIRLHSVDTSADGAVTGGILEALNQIVKNG
jgi:hypothetical protein